MTYATLKSRVSSEMKRGELSASATAVRSAIIDSIEHWSRRRFTWNEFNDVSASVSATYISYADLGVHPVRLDSVKVIVGSRNYPLDARSFDELDDMDAGNYTGYPDFYALHSQKMRLYPAPNQAMTVVMAGVRKLEEISAQATGSASNAWSGEGEQIVRLMAKSFLFRDELHDHGSAQVFATEAERIAAEIQRETAHQTGGRIRGHW